MGVPVFIGVDPFGAHVYALGTGWLSAPLEHAVCDLVELACRDVSLCICAVRGLLDFQARWAGSLRAGAVPGVSRAASHRVVSPAQGAPHEARGVVALTSLPGGRIMKGSPRGRLSGWMARKRGGLVRRVEPGSLAEHLGVEPGDSIVAVNGRRLRDEIDFRYLTADPDVTLLIRKRDGSQEAYRIDKDPDEPLGVSFQDPLFDHMKTCKNNCVFCFIRQIPKEMRKSLHVRDDDYRMSFLHGNFVSLTNLDAADWARIEEQRISPLRVSVHTTDPELRQVLMSNPEAAKIMHHLRLTRLDTAARPVRVA